MAGWMGCGECFVHSGLGKHNPDHAKPAAHHRRDDRLGETVIRENAVADCATTAPGFSARSSARRQWTELTKRPRF